MHREGKFRVWKPKHICVCEDIIEVHEHRTGKCTVPMCGCAKFKDRVWAKKEHARGQEFKCKRYDSGLEARVAADLNRQLACGELIDVRRQFPADIVINGIKILRYYVDFRVVHNDETVEFIEVKGVWDQFSKMKRNLFEACFLQANPGAKYRVLR